MPDKPLNEARLRELARTLRTQKERGSAFPLYWGSDIIAANNANADAIEALLNALSAERKRGDRAVGLLRELFEHGPFDVMIGGNPLTVDALQDQINEILATQKAEGATSTPATTDDSPPPR